MKTEVSKETTRGTVQAYYEVTSDADTYRLHIYMPGVPRDGITLQVDKGILKIEGKRACHQQPKWRALQREIQDVDFYLNLQLSVDLDESRIVASTKEGVLTLVLPLAEESKPRQIAIE